MLASIFMKAVCMYVLSGVQLFETTWTVTQQTLLSMEFSRQEYWSGLPFLPPGNISNPGIEWASLSCSASADGFFTTVPPGKPSEGYQLVIFIVL